MESYILFLLLGLGAGAVYGVLGLGLVLQYRSSGVINFAHGAMAMFIAYVFVELRDDGTLVFPWIGLPNELSLSGSGVATVPALLTSLAYAAVFGLVVYLALFRALRNAHPLARVGASIGLMLALQAVAVLNFGTETRSTAPILPSGGVSLGGVQVPVDRLWLAAITLVLAAALAAGYRFSRFGLATRAAAENEKGAALVGLSANRIAMQNWVLATTLAGLAGILIVPIATLDPGSYTLFIIPALGVALIGRFESFLVVALGGLLLGMLQSETTKLQQVWDWLPQEGFKDALPFLVILVILVVLGRGLPARGLLAETRSPSVGRPSHPLRTSAACFAAGLFVLLVLQGSERAAFTTSLIAVCVCLSLVVLTGYTGQVSLAQMSFAGVGGFGVSHLADGAGIPFPVSMLLAGLVAVPVGVLIGIPALRIRGVSLAVVTLAAAAAMDAVLFSNEWFSGGFAGRRVPDPTFLGIDLAINGDTSGEYPRAAFGVMVLLVVVVLGYLVARLRNARAGRMFLAVRSNERAAASVGIDVTRAKLLAFGLSAFIAAIGGALLAYQQSTLSPGSFSVFASLNFLAIAYVAGIGRIAGAVLAGFLLAPAGLALTLGDRIVDVGAYQLLIAGCGLMLMSVLHPDGLASTGGALRAVVRRMSALPSLQGRAPAAADLTTPTPLVSERGKA